MSKISIRIERNIEIRIFSGFEYYLYDIPETFAYH